MTTIDLAVRPQTAGWRGCSRCDVRWKHDRHCWSCGQLGEDMFAPVIRAYAMSVTRPRGVRPPLAACAECGNDDPCEGYDYCSDCLPIVYPET